MYISGENSFFPLPTAAPTQAIVLAPAVIMLATGMHSPYIPRVPHRQPSLAELARLFTILKGSAMNARFLRDEAARFRGMADDAGRDATKLRLLAMAADYEARADIADELTNAHAGEPVEALAEPTQDEDPEAPAETALGETLKLKPGRRIVRETKETIMVDRRPTGRRG